MNTGAIFVTALSVKEKFYDVVITLVGFILHTDHTGEYTVAWQTSAVTIMFEYCGLFGLQNVR